MSEHSKYFSPSSIHRRLVCRGSAFLEAGMPDISSDAADEGTLLHSYMEAFNSCQTVPELTGDRAEAFDKAATMTVRAMGMVPAGSQRVEEKVSLENLGYPEVFGTADLIADSIFDTLLVLDYKFGQVRVSPNCPQLKTYALAAGGPALNYYERIILAIAQPAVSDDLQIYETTPVDLMSWFMEDLKPCIEDIKAGVKTFNPTDAGCLYCKGKEICPAYTQNALVVARQDFGGDPGDTMVTTINDELVAEYYPKLPLLESWISQVKAHALNMASRGSLPGYKMVAGRSARKWTDEAQAEEVIKAAGADPYEHKLLSVAKAEKLGKEVKEAIQPIIEKIPGSPVIAPENDRRKALPTAAEDFKQVA
jgi:hypothetical protein